jgi:hypothetical protein
MDTFTLFVARAFGANVAWDAANHAVQVSDRANA